MAEAVTLFCGGVDVALLVVDSQRVEVLVGKVLVAVVSLGLVAVGVTVAIDDVSLVTIAVWVAKTSAAILVACISVVIVAQLQLNKLRPSSQKIKR